MLVLGPRESVDDTNSLLPSHKDVMASLGGSVDRHRRLQSQRRHHRSDHLCLLIALLGCIQLVVVTTVIGWSMLTPSANNSTEKRITEEFRHLEVMSATSQLNMWFEELLVARNVTVHMNSSLPAHFGFVLNGTFRPKPSSASLVNGEFIFGDSRGIQNFVVVVEDHGYEWIKSSYEGERVSSSGCLRPAHLPPLHLLRNSFSTGQWAPDESIQFTFAHSAYRVQKNNQGFHVSSPNGVHIWLKMNMGSYEIPLDFVAKVTPTDLSLCPRLFDPQEALSGYPIVTDQTPVRSSATQEFADHKCPCTSQGKKKCLFLHGIGVHKDIGLVDSYPDYWGTIEKILPCCSDVKFAHLNTVDSPWYDELFAERICDAMVSIADNTTFSLTTTVQLRQPTIPLIKNTVVIAHSTGNLHLASALLYKKCQLDLASSKWIAIEGPMRGTNTANRALEECAQPPSGWNTLVKKVVRDFELCPVKNSTQSLVLANTTASSGCLDKLFVKAQGVYETVAYANLCGVSPFGLASTSSPKFVALATFSNHSSSNNDGVVEFKSCAKQAMGYQTTYHTRFYKASINHDDGRLIHGDGLWGDNRRPIQWLQCQF